MRLFRSISVGLLLGALVAASPRPGHAQGNSDQVACDTSGNTHELNRCAELEFEAADRDLNDVYKKVLAQIALEGGDKPWDGKTWEARVRAAQRAWVAFRDADCKDAVPMEWQGGTGTTAAVLGCMSGLTKARTLDLKERFNID